MWLFCPHIFYYCVFFIISIAHISYTEHSCVKDCCHIGMGLIPLLILLVILYCSDGVYNVIEQRFQWYFERGSLPYTNLFVFICNNPQICTVNWSLIQFGFFTETISPLAISIFDLWAFEILNFSSDTN